MKTESLQMGLYVSECNFATFTLQRSCYGPCVSLQVKTVTFDTHGSVHGGKQCVLFLRVLCRFQSMFRILDNN